MIDESEEAPTALSGVATIHPGWHAAALLLKRQSEQNLKYQDQIMRKVRGRKEKSGDLRLGEDNRIQRK